MVADIGKQLGKYRLLRLLGRGGFAEVYLGQHLYLKSNAALKVLRTSLEDEDVTQFMTEAQTLARLTHPHIVRVLDFDVNQGFPMLVMEYSPGGTLRQRHPQGECLSLATTVSYINQVASALSYAHAHGVIHRDVKPENILLENQQQVRLSDFGIALFAPSPDQLSTQAMAGTIPYMAPEQLQGKPCVASDQYALGIIAYEWLCGVRPFEGTYWQLAHQHLSAPPPALREQDPSLPAGIEAVVLKALAKEPHQRYASVQRFAQALEQAAQAAERDLRDAFEVTAPLQTVSPEAPVAPLTVPRKVLLAAFPDGEPFVARLAADLQARGITVWNAHPEATQPAGNEREPLWQAMRAVDALLLVSSPTMSSSRMLKEYLQLAARYKRPIIYVQTGGDESSETLPLLERGRIVNAHPARYGAALDEMVACLEREPSLTSGEEAGLATAARNPYKGLRAFRAEDAQDFFGRDTLIAEMTDQLRELLVSQPAQSRRDRLLTVIGPSGSGKSSVVMAGLLPRLASGALAGSDSWVYLDPMVPGTHPLEALCLALAPHFPNRSVKSIREDLEDDPARGLHLLASQLVKGSDQQVVLLVDQFEELFTLTTEAAERQHLIDLLVTAATEPGGPLMLVLTLRADFYDRPIAYPGLARLLLRHQCLVLPMELQELRAAVKHPAQLSDVQLTFEGNLVGDLLHEVQGQPGALPLLQFTLDLLFQRRSGSTLTLEAYHDIGGVKGALTRQAEKTYDELPSEEHRRLSRALFVRLIDLGASEQDTTRRRAALAEFTLDDQAETRLLRETIDAFVAARLLTANEVSGTTTIEVSHEALIREWPRLGEWMRAAREDIPLQQALSRDVAEWQQRGKPGHRLYRSAQLQEAQAWAARNMPSAQERAFLRASIAQRQRSIVSIFAAVMLILASLSTATWIVTHPQPAQPDPTRVTNLRDDDSVGSLRWAIEQAPAGKTITFAPGVRGTIVLKRNLVIGKVLTIKGPGARLLTIRGSSNGQSVSIAKDVTVTIVALAFQGDDQGCLGQAPAAPTCSGLIYNEGTLSLVRSTVSGNTGLAGGGIYNNGGTLTLTSSTISGNTAQDGGGIFIGDESSLRVTTSTTSGIGAREERGIYISGSLPTTIANSAISGNTAFQGVGGGIFANVPFTVTTSTIANNKAMEGGGIALVGTAPDFKQFTLISCTLYGNAASPGADISIFDVDSQGKPLPQQSSTVTISNSIVAGPAGPDMQGTFISQGHNLFLANSGATFDPETQAQHAFDLLGTGQKITTDQRGMARPDDGESMCDIGAYES